MTRVAQAREIARRWVTEEGVGVPGFAGAFLTGSTLWAHGDEELEPSSDVDVMVVLDTAEAPAKLGKFVHRGVLLEVSFMPAASLGTPEAVLGDYHLAGGFHVPSVLADPTGRLTEIQRAVSVDFARRRWVLARCAHAADAVRTMINGMDTAASFPDQVMPWLFGTGVTTHVLLVAGLRNPTIRRRYAAVRELLAERDRLECHESLLELLGCAEMGRSRVEHHLAVLEKAFDAAAAVQAESYRFASDVSDAGRAISIGGTRELIGRGLHREAVFWLVATYSRCLAKLSVAGSATRPYEDGLRALLADLGAETFDDRRRRGERVLATLPELWRTAEAIAPS
ncbi:hypothetical protein IMZ11_07310 [Microtetraspora sp. AC03309]|uniref:hypothetical protein n=1 Tax=Microtetraspora sp. AC03309 TaxID=2779376 RepID=UPI001E5A6EA9|nr:hypothetical protein [Microtetraspora sp. AC03309]MCC5575448.1 hypothetical protein [Microtetraspora sp. AC03309]